MAKSFVQVRAFTQALGRLSESERGHLAALVEYADIVESFSDEECRAFLLELEEKKKDAHTAAVWCAFLGLFGAHHFYLNSTVRAFVYLIMTCTVALSPITVVLAFVDFCTMNQKVKRRNRERALEIRLKIHRIGTGA